MRMPFSAALLVWAALDLAAFSGGALAQLSGPANLPPFGFQGLQFVDGRGCLFLRAGFGAQTVWVPMVDESHAQICNMAPSFGAAAAAAAAAATAAATAAPVPQTVAPVTPVAPLVPAAKPAPVVVAAAPAVNAPVIAAPVLAAQPTPAQPAPSQPAPSQSAPAQRGYQSAALGTTTASCLTRAPVLERVVLRNGGTALVCTQGDGTLTGWNPPIFAAGAGVGAALGYQTATTANLQGARLAGPLTARAAAPPRAAQAAPVVSAVAAIPTPPKGWKLAWKDDRLNPMRGVGTATGQAQMDARWTREVPANLVTEAPALVVFAVPPAVAVQPDVRVSTMSAPAPLPAATVKAAPKPGVASLALYVQIGSFGVPANAAGAAARITALGLPSALGHLTRGGSTLQVVYAGPFADANAAGSALAVLKSAGFRDAFVR